MHVNCLGYLYSEQLNEMQSLFRQKFKVAPEQFKCVEGHRSGAKRKKFFLAVPPSPTFLAIKVQLVVLVNAFEMVSTVWSVSCLLFVYSRCTYSAQPFVKVGARAPPCPMESAPLSVSSVKT